MSDPGMDLEALRNGVRDVLDREASSARVHRLVDDEALIDRALWETAVGLGWTALTIPEAQDGLGLGITETAVVFEELGRTLAPLPYLGSVLAARAIALAGSESQKARWLPLIAGGAICAVWTPDPGATSSPTIRPDGPDIVLSGVTADVLQGAGADLLLVEVRDAAGAAAYALVEPKTDGVELVLERTVDRTRHLARANFDDLRLPADRLLADPNGTVGQTLLAEATLALACDAVGGAEAIFARTIDYLKTREQFGKPIGSFQALKHRCADHRVAMSGSAAVVTEAVRLQALNDPTAALMATMAKAYACEVYAKVAEDAVQLHGGIGYTWEHDCHLFLKRAKLNQALLGGTAANLDRAGRLLVAA